MRRIYVASSWRNPHQPGVVEALRKAGHLVYDVRNPAKGERGFSWGEVDPDWRTWTGNTFRAALKHPISQRGFDNDHSAMEWADTLVLVLPCGRSAHLEAGWAAGAGKQVWILLLGENEPELMYKEVEAGGGGLVLGVEELVEKLGVPLPWPVCPSCEGLFEGIHDAVCSQCQRHLLRGAKARGDCSATLRRVHELLCTDGDPEATLVHLGEVLDDAGAPKPVCDRGPECPSLHLNSRIHDLADQRDSLLNTLANERGEGNPPVGWAWDGSAWCRPPYVVARAQSGAFRWDVTYVDDVDGDDIVAEADTARDAMRAADRHQDEDQGARSP